MADTGKVYDISKIDFDRLKREFEKSKNKNTAVQSLKDAVEVKLRRMVERNPLRMDFYKRYQEILAEYNRETDRVTIERTFEALMTLVRDLGDEEQRAVREGLNEEFLALFDLLRAKKDDLDTKTRNQVKDVARKLLDAIKAELGRLEDWRAKEQTRAQVRTLIYNFLYDERTGLPPAAYNDNDVEEVTGVVFQHVFTQYKSATEHPYAA